MPAASEVALPELPHTWRPLGVRVAGVFFFSILLIVCAFAWFGFTDEVRSQFTLWQRSTLVGLAALIGAVLFGLYRSRITATDEGLVVVNGYRTHTFAWAEVVAIRLPSGAPWATLDISNGTTCQVIALQGADGVRARDGVRAVRALLAR